MKLRVKPLGADAVDAVVDILPPKTARRILISAVNDTAKRGESRLSKLIRETIAMKKKAVDEAISRRTTRDDEGGFGQQVNVSRKKAELREFSPRQTKAGITVKLLKGQKPVRMRSAFVVGKLGGNVFRRFGPKRKNSRGRLKQAVRKLMGPTAVGGLTRRDADVNAIRDDSGEYLRQRFVSKAEFEMSKLVTKSQRK